MHKRQLLALSEDFYPLVSFQGSTTKLLSNLLVAKYFLAFSLVCCMINKENITDYFVYVFDTDYFLLCDPFAELKLRYKRQCN